MHGRTSKSRRAVTLGRGGSINRPQQRVPVGSTSDICTDYSENAGGKHDPTMGPREDIREGDSSAESWGVIRNPGSGGRACKEGHAAGTWHKQHHLLKGTRPSGNPEQIHRTRTQSVSQTGRGRRDGHFVTVNEKEEKTRVVVPRQQANLNESCKIQVGMMRL